MDGHCQGTRDPEGNIIRFVGTSTDIHDLKAAQEENARLYRGEVRALKDQLYKEHLVLRDEVDRTGPGGCFCRCASVRTQADRDSPT